MIKTVAVPTDSRLIEVLSAATGESKSNLRRMLTSSGEGGIRILIGNEYIPLAMEELNNKIVESELIIKVGKRRHYRIQTVS